MIFLNHPVFIKVLGTSHVYVVIGMFSALRDTLLSFKVLDTSGRGRLELHEFLHVYEAVALRWRPRGDTTPWFHSSTARNPVRLLGEATRAVHDWPHFETLVCK
jgi:hypothetical protein